jgi:trimethylamine--corrinoid protein Co-methyltransferase
MSLISNTSAEQIHRASLSLLADPGIRIENEEVAQRLLAAGAQPGLAPGVIRFSEGLLKDCLASAPSTVYLAGHATRFPLSPQGEDSQIWSTPGMQILDRDQIRPFTSRDLAAMARLLDRLPSVNGVFGVALHDFPPGTGDVVGLRILAENTRKHIRVLCFTPHGADVLCEMNRVFADSPRFSVGFTAHGPLRWTHLALEIFKRTAGHGIPVSLNGEPMAGTSAPVTLAGAAAVGNAEILAGLIVNQVLEPGRPCIHNLGLAHVFDMRSAGVVTGGPENHLFAGIGAALGRFYNLPSCSWVSTESLRPDAQSGLEKMAGFMTHLQQGVSLIWGVGQLESELTLSPAQAVIDDEIIGYARRFLRGIEVSEESLALSVIREVGIAGNFLEHEHTLQHFRSELFEPHILCRQRRPLWKEKGSLSLAEIAEEKARALMADPIDSGLSEDQIRELHRIESAFLNVPSKR